MSVERRWIDLWNDYLEGDLDETRFQELRDLLASDDRLLRLAADSFRTHRLLGLVFQDTTAAREAFVRETMEDLPSAENLFVGDVMDHIACHAPRGRVTRAGWSARWVATIAVVATAAVVLIAAAITGRPGAHAETARITALAGSLEFTGERGQVMRDVRAGAMLTGGTLESLSAESWAEIAFQDGSTITLSGQSALTFSQRGQKELHLREGRLSASVAPQPPGRPMLIYTPTAKLEVLGTRLDVDARPTSTRLMVNEGLVRVTRLDDGSVTQVPARHQVVASLERPADFTATPRPAAVSRWRSTLPSDATYGSWLQKPEEDSWHLRTVPLLLKNREPPVTLYLAVVSVSRGRSTPIVATSGATIRIRGRVELAGDVYFGVTANHVDGGFAGKYSLKHTFDAATGTWFDVEVRLEDFQPREARFAPSATDLELVDWWCCTYNADLGLSLDSIELIPAAREDSSGD